MGAYWWDANGGNDEAGAGRGCGLPHSCLTSASFCSESGEKKKEENLVIKQHRCRGAQSTSFTRRSPNLKYLVAVELIE